MFKVGDKVVFIDDKGIKDKPIGLILYHVYDVSDVSNMNRKLFEIDKFPEWVFPVRRFIPLSEFRKEKIKRIKNGKI